MTKILLTGFVTFFIYQKAYSQTTIDVVESTLKIGAMDEEVFYYGFAEGDQVIFNFEALKRKELKEIEIIEMPGSSKFMDYETKKVKDKVIHVSKTGIYKFRFVNSAVTGRVCKFKIQRIPANEIFKSFNTTVFCKTVNDTTYTTEIEKYLVSKDTTVVNLVDQIAKVHSQTNLNGSKTTLNFSLPVNTVSWSYYIGVDQSGQEAYEKASKQLAKSAAPIIARIPGYGPLAALAMGGASFLTSAQSGEDIDFYIVRDNNVNKFLNSQAFEYVKKGSVINDFSKMIDNYRGVYHVCLSNDNAIIGVTVTIKVTAIQVVETWGKRPYHKMHVKTWEEPYLKN